ncbi:MAG: hypothetical protein ACM3NQ_25435 [Bacteroidales bacterium]
MRRLLLGLAIALVAATVSVLAEDPPSKVQQCAAQGYRTDICATCVVAGIGNNAADFGACYCKFDQGLRARFETMGACVVFVQKNFR